jgi:hypothetical protein
MYKSFLWPISSERLWSLSTRYIDFRASLVGFGVQAEAKVYHCTPSVACCWYAFFFHLLNLRLHKNRLYERKASRARLSEASFLLFHGNCNSFTRTVGNFHLRSELCSAEFDVVGSEDPLMLKSTLEDLWSVRATKIREGLFNIAKAEEFLSVEVVTLFSNLKTVDHEPNGYGN